MEATYAEPLVSYGSAEPPTVRAVPPAAEEATRLLTDASDARPVRPRASVDTLLAIIALVFAILLANPERVPRTLEGVLTLRLTLQDVAIGAVVFVLWPKLLRLFGAYETRPAARSEVFSILAACTTGALLALGLVAFGRSEFFTYRTIAGFWLLSIGVTCAFRGFGQAINTTIASRVPRKILIIGSGVRALRLYRHVLAEPEALELVGFVDDSDESASGEIGQRMLGGLDDLENILMHHVVDEALIALPIKSCYADIQRAIDICARVGVESKYLADAFRCSIARPRFEHRATAPFMAMKVFYDDYRVSVKRAIDLFGALVGLIILSPVLLVIAIAIKATSPGPVLFVQERYGRNKRRFNMYKFRTMVPNAEALLPQLEGLNEADGPAFKIRNDPRITKIGRWLRKTSLDELPQLFNVLKGDMSLVGPRPMAVRDVKLFEQAWFMRRFSAPPGITGLWQVSGRSDLSFDDWVTLDLKYIDEWSLALDFRILTRTIPVVLRGVGAA